MKKVPRSVMAYLNADKSLFDGYTVVFPDGAVFTMSEMDKTGFQVVQYYCEFKDFRAQSNDKVVKEVPESVYNAILKLMV